MLKTILLSSLKFAAILPTLIASAYGLIEASSAGGFKDADPKHHQQMVDFANGILALAVEYWPGWIMLSIATGSVWALMVAEPKIASKKKFDIQRSQRLKKR